MNERCTIVVTPRDRFSTMETCLQNVFKNTGGSFEVIASMGGCPLGLREHLEKTFASRVKFIFESGYKNTAQLRNLALAKINTRLAAFLDSDVFVRPGWLEPLIQCQEETGAALVTPLVHDRNNRIHTAGKQQSSVRRYLQGNRRYTVPRRGAAGCSRS